MDNCCVAVFCGDGVVAVVPIRFGLSLLPLSLTRHTALLSLSIYIYENSYILYYRHAEQAQYSEYAVYISPRGLTVRYSESPLTLYADILLLYIRVFTRARKCLTK